MCRTLSKSCGAPREQDMAYYGDRQLSCLHSTNRRMSVMSLRPHALEPVPEATARVAHAAFPTGHPNLTFRDALGSIFQNEDCTAQFPAWGQPALSPWRFSLVTIMPFRGDRADRQAAAAGRAPIGWKDLLSLRLIDPGFGFFFLR